MNNHYLLLDLDIFIDEYWLFESVQNDYSLQHSDE